MIIRVLECNTNRKLGNDGYDTVLKTNRKVGIAPVGWYR